MNKIRSFFNLVASLRCDLPMSKFFFFTSNKLVYFCFEVQLTRSYVFDW
jgi:hypothetical protein